MRIRLKILFALITNNCLRLNFLIPDGLWRWRDSLVPFCQTRIGPTWLLLCLKTKLSKGYGP